MPRLCGNRLTRVRPGPAGAGEMSTQTPAGEAAQATAGPTAEGSGRSAAPGGTLVIPLAAMLAVVVLVGMSMI